MRAPITNPGALALNAMARHGTFGTTHARIESNEVVLRYAPDYARAGSQSLLTDTIGTAVDDGQNAVQRTYTTQIPANPRERLRMIAPTFVPDTQSAGLSITN